MTRTEATAELARLETAKPTFGSFAKGREERKAELRTLIASLPVEATPATDAGYDAWIASQDRHERAVRNQQRRGY